MAAPRNLLLQQLMDLQNRITEQAGLERLELTPGEVVLLSYALGGFTGQVLKELEAVETTKRQAAESMLKTLTGASSVRTTTKAKKPKGRK
jgi:hypothetical protein